MCVRMSFYFMKEAVPTHVTRHEEGSEALRGLRGHE